MDTSIIYSQLINFEESETDHFDETPNICFPSIKPLNNNEYGSSNNLYDNQNSYDKTFLNYFQPYSTDPIMIHPHQTCTFENSLINDTHLGDPIHQVMTDQQKEPFSWLYNDPLDISIGSMQSESTNGYVNLSDVNSYVAKIDSAKYSTVFPYNEPQNSYCQTDIIPETISFKDSDDEDEDSNLFSDTSEEDEWPLPDMLSENDLTSQALERKLLMKVKQPMSLNAIGSSLYPDWVSSVNTTPLTNTPFNMPLSNSRKYRKSVPIIQSNICKKQKGPRRGSAPNTIRKSSSNLSTMASSSSLSSLSNNLKRTMKVSESLNSLLTQEEDMMEESSTDNIFEETEDEEEDECQTLSKKKAKNAAALLKKGKNVDKACNHCKRSHLRCDEMRPCRRCITTGKIGCRDVQHKPRGRPKLSKNLE